MTGVQTCALPISVIAATVEAVEGLAWRAAGQRVSEQSRHHKPSRLCLAHQMPGRLGGGVKIHATLLQRALNPRTSVAFVYDTMYTTNGQLLRPFGDDNATSQENQRSGCEFLGKG